MTQEQRKARWAGSTLFLVDGVGFGTWAALIPTFKHTFALSDGALSWALLGLVTGALIAMPAAGQVISRCGTRFVLGWMAPVFALSLCLLVFAPTFPALVVAAAVFGALKGSFDVAINSQAIVVENAVGRPIMATFQALWSIGGLVAALLVGLAIHQGLQPWLVGSTISVALLILALVSTRHLLADGQSVDRSTCAASFQWPSRRIWQIGALAFLALFAEGAMMDWGAVYSRSVAGAAEWLAPLAYGVFCLSMAAGRLAGDALRTRLGALRLLRTSGVLTTTGLVTIVLFPWWPATFAGLSLAGLGLSNLVPLFFGAGGREHAGGVGQGIAAVSMMGYFGFLAGPPIIGGLSGLLGLPVAFLVVAGFGLFLAIAGPGLLAGPVQRKRAVSVLPPLSTQHT